MIPLIVGANGNMGRRYQAILRHLNVPFVTQDIDGIRRDHGHQGGAWDSVILATPTADHGGQILKFAEFGVPILCEKPITKDLEELERIVTTMERSYSTLQMVNQYEFLATYDSGITFYDYFKSGGDGLAWDTINIGALARGEFSAWDNSPIWRCTINGKALNLADMDGAYVAMMRQWLTSPRGDLDYIIMAHEKAAARAKEKSE